MGRNNDARRAIEIFNVISKNRPDIFLETIFLACYPTESEKNIKLNMAFLDTFNIGNSLISVYKYGSNVASLKSENIESRTREKHLEMLSYYEYFIVPKIEQQREKLLSQQVIGRLIERDEQFDYYSTNFRFVTREYVIKCPRDDNNKMYEWYEISTDMLQRNGKIIYDVEGREGNGRVLRRVSNKNNV